MVCLVVTDFIHTCQLLKISTSDFFLRSAISFVAILAFIVFCDIYEYIFTFPYSIQKKRDVLNLPPTKNCN